MSQEHRDLKAGLKWNSLGQLINQVSIFFTGFILMRLLTPADFGLVAIVTVFIGFSQLLTDVGLSSSIVNKKNLTRSDFDNVFTFSFFIGLILAILFFFVSTPLSSFFGDSRLVTLFKMAAAAMLFAPLGSIPAAMLRRELQFKALAISQMISTFTALAVSLTMAYLGYGYFSLIAQNLVLVGLNVVLLFIFSKYTPTFWLNFSNLRSHMVFGIPVLGSRIINYSISNVDNLLIGKILGTNALGYYGRAFSLVTIPSTKIGFIINTTLFPVFSKMKNQNHDIRRSVLKLYEIIIYTLLLLALIYIVAARSLITLIFPTGQWDAVIPLIQALAFVSIFAPANRFYSSILASKALTKRSFTVELKGGFVILIGFVIGVNFNILYFSYIYCLSSLIYFTYYSAVFVDIMKFNASELFNRLKFKLLSFLLITAFCYLFLQISFTTPLLELILGILMVSISWVGLNFLLEKDPSIFIFKTFKSIFNK